MEKNRSSVLLNFVSNPFISLFRKCNNEFEILGIKIIKAATFAFILWLILPNAGICQHKSSSEHGRIKIVEKDERSGNYKVQLEKMPQAIDDKSQKQRIDPQKFEEKINTLKKIENQHELFKNIFETKKQVDKELLLKESAEGIELERIKLFGKPTVFYKAPFIPKTVNSFLSKTLISNVLINGKPQDTILVHDPFTLTFSFAPNYLSAVVNIYFDLDNNGTISENDFMLIDNGLVMDNDDYDEDFTSGSYQKVFPRESFYTDLVSTLIFEVNDFNSISSAFLTINQESKNAVIMGEIVPPLKNLLVEAKSPSFDEFYVFTDSLVKFKVNIDRNVTKQVYLEPGDLFGVTNGYIYPNENLVLDINSDTTAAVFTYSPASAFIEGYVRDQYGAGVKYAQIEAEGNNGSSFILIKADSLGHYKIGVKQGEHRLYASIETSSDYMRDYNNDATVFVPDNSTVQQDFTILKANSAISGKITLNSNAIGGIPIRANVNSLSNIVLSSSDGNYELPVYDPAAGNLAYSVSPSVPRGYSVFTQPKTNVNPGAKDINFEIRKVTGGLEGRVTDNLTGNPITGARITMSGNNYYSSKYSNDSGYYRMSLPNGVYSLMVSANGYFPYSEYSLSIMGAMRIKNVALFKSGSFSGNIKDEEGNPIDQAVIMAMDTSGYSIGSYGFPDQLGNYTVSQLTTSMYGAYATASFGENNVYLSQWYDKASEKDSAKFFQVYQGYDTPNINFVLEKGGSISGRAVDKFENGIAGVSVDVLDSLFNQKSYAITNDSGYYLAGGLSTGEYFIRISNYEYIEQWYNGAASYENATKVSVVVKQNTPNINFILSSGASISGTVKDKRNSGLPYASVTIVDSTYLPTNFSSADNAGKYYTPKLQGNKTYYVMAQNYGYTSQWYNLVSTSDSATPIILQPEERRENIDFILSMEGGAISGGVSNNNGNPLANIYVNIMDSIGNTISQGYTDYYGKYEVKNISSGKYYAKATDFNYLYEDQWYDHKYSKFEADPIYVFEDAVTENINFNLFKVGEIKSDSILIKLELVNIPDTLTFSQAHVSDYTVDYWWGIKFDVDGLSSTGTNGYEIEVALIHFKQPGELPFKSNLIDGTYAQLIEWNANYGEVRHQNFNVWIDESNKNILTISVPKFWAELRNVNTNTKYFAHTSHLASNGGFQDFTSSSYGGAPITDAIGDVSYDFIDLVSTSWEIKLLVLAENEEEIPKDYSLSQNYPNPFNPCTRISWQSPVSSWQTIKVYDVLGNEVAALVDEYRDAGGYTIEFNASNLASGIYLYRIQAGKFVETKKMILIK